MVEILQNVKEYQFVSIYVTKCSRNLGTACLLSPLLNNFV